MSELLNFLFLELPPQVRVIPESYHTTKKQNKKTGTYKRRN